MFARRPYRVVNDDYVRTAPVHVTICQSIPATAEATFRSFSEAVAWPRWFPGIERVVWTSPEPFEVGTTRDVYALHMVISEEFTTWEPGHRMSFYAATGTNPLYAAFAEDYQLLPTGTETCDLTWRCGLQPPHWLGFLRPLQRLALTWVARRGFRQLAVFMAENAERFSA